MTPRRLYLIRHGETDWNAERRLQGQRDIPLNDRGRAQSARCSDILRALLAASGRVAEEFAFISSPLSRARETMEIIRAGLSLTPQHYVVDNRLAEMSFGRWEGLTYAEIRALDRTGLAMRERDKWNFCPPNGESYAKLCARVSDWQAELVGDAIVAAHGGVARALMVVLGIRSPAEAPLGDIAQGVIYEFGPSVVNRHDWPVGSPRRMGRE
jgi:broad specificity phosphatase PhoE